MLLVVPMHVMSVVLRRQRGDLTTYKSTGLASTIGICKPSSGVSALPISQERACHAAV